MNICGSSALPVCFKQKLKNVLIEEGSSATFRCELSKPRQAVEWRMGRDELIENGEKFHMRHRDVHAELKILNAAPEDSNIYTCICGDIETSATLTVNGTELPACCSVSFAISNSLKQRHQRLRSASNGHTSNGRIPSISQCQHM